MARRLNCNSKEPWTRKGEARAGTRRDRVLPVLDVESTRADLPLTRPLLSPSARAPASRAAQVSLFVDGNCCSNRGHCTQPAQCDPAVHVRSTPHRHTRGLPRAVCSLTTQVSVPAFPMGLLPQPWPLRGREDWLAGLACTSNWIWLQVQCLQRNPPWCYECGNRKCL